MPSQASIQASADIAVLLNTARLFVRRALENRTVPPPAETERPTLVCRDNFQISVQAGAARMCSPRIDEADAYSHVEVILPLGHNEAFSSWTTAAKGVYGMVPAEVVLQFIACRGGVDNGKTVQYRLNRLAPPKQDFDCASANNSELAQATA